MSTATAVATVNKKSTNLAFGSMAAGKAKIFFKDVLGLTATASLDFPSTAAGTSSDLTITVAGAVLGSVVSVGVPIAAVIANSSYSGWVSAPGVITVRFSNHSGGALDPALGVFTVNVR